MDKYQWSLDTMYPTEEQLKADMETVKTEIDQITALSKTGSKEIFALLEQMEKTAIILSKLASYSHMKRDEDSRVPESQKRALVSGTLDTEFNAATSFLRPMLLSMTDEEIAEMKANPKYEHFKLLIERELRYKEHTLSEREEYVLGTMHEMADSPGMAYYMLTNADMVFPHIQSNDNIRLTNANYTTMLKSEDRAIRKEAFEKYYQTYSYVDNTIASTLYSNIRNLVIESKLRGFPTAREKELFEDDVPLVVYDNLIESIHTYLPSLHRYYEIRKKMMKLDEQHMYDVYANVQEGFERKITFEEAKEILLEALKPLGEDYIQTMKQGFEDRWIDVYPREGKKSGAYSFGHYTSAPYILMNYNDNLDSLFTLAHELGHSMHSYYSRENNPYIYSQYTIFVAEVASTTNELLLLDYLIKNAASDRERMHLLNHHIDSFKSTVFRQTMFAEFERETHRLVEGGNALTLNDFNGIYAKLNREYFGEAVVQDDEIKLEWARIPHFYRNFYVYKYATGFSAATILSQRILNAEEGAIEAYKKFLSDGGQHFPLEQLIEAGADMSDKQTVDRALQVFEKLVQSLDDLS